MNRLSKVTGLALAEESRPPIDVDPTHIGKQDIGGTSGDGSVLSPRGRGGDAVSGNAGNANGGSVVNTGGTIINGPGSNIAGNGGTSISGDAIGGDAGGSEDSAPPAGPSPSPGRAPSTSSQSSGLPAASTNTPASPPASTARPPPSPPPAQSSKAPPGNDSTPKPIPSLSTMFSETIQGASQTGGVSLPSDVLTASQAHHPSTSVKPPATAQHGGGGARHAGPGPSRSLLLKILLPVFAVLLLAGLATALVLRRRRRWRRLAETPTAYVFPRESVVSDNSSRNSSKQRLIDAMAGKPGSSQTPMHEPEISRASSSASGAPNTAALLDAMRHAGLPVSVVAVLQNPLEGQESEVPPSYHRGQMDLEASTSALPIARAA